MRQYKARLAYKDEDKPPFVIDIEDEIIIRRSQEKYSVVCEQGAECFSLGMFDPSVSGGKGHAKLFWEKDKLYIQDLGSSNGTYLIIDKKEVPLRGWSPARGENQPNLSEEIRINKTQNMALSKNPVMNVH